MRFLKITISVLFVVLVAFFVARGCLKKTPHLTETDEMLRAPMIVHKPVVVAPKPKQAVPAPPAPAPLSVAPKMAIILDDWGTNFFLTKYAFDLNRPITLAILPNLPKSRQIAEEAHRKGLGVMLHLPMEPRQDGPPLEPNTIMTGMTEAGILKDMDVSLESVPYAEGVNNHMGSAATSDSHVMRIVLKHLKGKGLYFVDSHVVPETVGARVAQEVGVRFAERDVFIDNVMDESEIRTMLTKATKIALRHGSVVVIGHDRKLTLMTLQKMVPEIEKMGIRFVLVRDLVEKQ